MLPPQEQFLRKAWQAAVDAHHIFPEMAACEAALESGYGHSQLATQDNNLFGMKQHRHPLYGTVSLPTREFLSNEWVTVNSNWIVYGDWQSCFADRMATLERLAPHVPHYRAALAAVKGEEYVIQVSESWSTDPGWQCSCGAIFQSQVLGEQHAAQAQHKLSTVLGLGRGEKVLAIFNAITGDWSATETHSP
jgi:flagellum-specific peptidoglycan hydrolase FlgJ